tara:strand:+ start:9685 stop:11652 length:1968 start_codon:yes stop_codon:yes gene_type:complete
MKPETKGTMSYEDRRRFAVGVLKGIAAPVTAGNVETLLAWMSRENTAARNNPMATTFPSDGWKAFNYRTTPDGTKVPHVKHYPSFKEGVRSTVLTLLGYSKGNLLSDRQVAKKVGAEPRYPVVLDLLRRGTDPQEIIDNSEAAEEVEKWGTFEKRIGYGAKDTWGYTREELESLAPGELEALNSETLRPSKGYDFPDPTTSFAVENKSDTRKGADVEQFADIQEGRPEVEAPFTTESADVSESTDVMILDTQKLAQSAFEETRQRLLEGPVTIELLDRYQELAKELSLNELGELEMGEAESALFKESLEGATGPMVMDYYIDPETGEKVYFEAISMDEETSNAFLKALGVEGLDGLDDETAALIRDNLGSVSFFEQRTPDFMYDSDGDGEGDINIIEWLIANPNKSDVQILEALRSVPWFQSTGPFSRQFQMDYFNEGPAGKDELISTQRDAILKEAKLIGFNWIEDDPELLNNLAYEASMYGWSDADRRRALVGLNTYEASDFKRGKILANRQTVLDTAAKYYVPIGESAANDLAFDIYEGDETTESLEAMYREQAKGMFPTLSGLIDQGITPKTYFSPYQEKISQLLEVSDVDLMNDPRFQAIMFPEAGKGPLSLYETQRYVRQLPEWQYTKNADESARRMVNNIGKIMGVVA